jgi:hypothetical protein
MRAIIKPSPPPPQISSGSFNDYATALGNSVGRFCSFCEKALNYQLLLFHKEQGVLAPTVQLTADDWASLLLVCGDCASNAGEFNPETGYFWPDTDDAQQCPYLYNLADNVAVEVINPDSSTYLTTTASVILVSVSSDVSEQIQSNAQNTYNLFQLNGKFFNGNFEQPGYTLPLAEYAHATDARLNMRMDAYLRAEEAGGALVRGIPTIRISHAYVGNLLAMINLAVNGFGFLSTWQAGVIATLNAADPALLPQLIGLMSGQMPTQPLDRKRTATVFDESVQQADEVAATKRAKLETALGQIIAVQS